MPKLKRMILAVVCLVSCLTVLTGCGGTPATYYYRLDYDMPAADGEALPLTLGIAGFETDVLYSGDRIVFRNSPYEVQFYHYRRWVAPPKLIVYEQVLKQFKASGAFKNVVEVPSTARPDYILNGKLIAFEEWDEDEKWYGKAGLSLELYHRDTREIVWKSTVTEVTSATERTPAEVVKAISISLRKLTAQAIGDIKNELRNRPDQ